MAAAGLRPGGAAARPHLGLAAVFGLALAVGRLRWGAALAPGLIAVGAGAIASFLVLAWTDTWEYPPPFEPGRYEARRRELEGLIGPVAGG